MMNALWQALTLELRNGMRQLTRRAAHSALIVAVLSIGLGATLFVLVAIDAMILRPMPFPHAERLVQIGETSDQVGRLDQMNSQDLLELGAALTQFESLESFAGGTMNIADGGSVERHDGQFVSGGLFALLGAQAQLGRTLDRSDDQPGASLRVVISDRVWRQRFAADPAVIGKAVRLNAQPAEIVGVMPPRFAFPFESEVWAAARYAPGQPIEQQREATVLALLREGVSTDAAASELTSVWSRLQAAVPETRRDVVLALIPASAYFVNPQTRAITGVLLIAALSVLLVACANVANLQLANLSQRSRELALRAAIGAGRGRLLLGLLTETLVLAAIATVFALLIADWAGVQTMRTFVEAGDGPAYWIDFRMTPRVAVFGVVIAVVTTVAAGLVPGLRASGFQLQSTLAETGRAGGGATRIARLLIVAQVAFSCVLLIGAGMVWRLLEARSNADLGIDTPAEELLTARIGIFPQQYPTEAEQVAFFERVAERVRSEPGVRAATIAESLPGFTSGATELLVEGQDPSAPRPEVLRSAIDDQFGATYGVTPLSGRMPDARDRADSLRVAVVDQRFAERYWPGQDALGRRFKLGQDDSRDWISVIGVVGNLQLEDVDDPQTPSVLLPMRQAPVRFATLAIHTEADPVAFAPRLAEIMREVDANTPVYWVRTLAQTLATDRVGDRFLTRLFALFGLTGLLLSGAGLFGVLAQVVQARTREIGVRRAIGADQGEVFRLISGDSARLLVLGLVIGLLLAVPWAQMLGNTAIGVNPFDPLIYVAVVVLVLLAGALAVVVPTRRALGIAPSEALRND
jgi:predicted permease